MDRFDVVVVATAAGPSAGRDDVLEKANVVGSPAAKPGPDA